MFNIHYNFYSIDIFLALLIDFVNVLFCYCDLYNSYCSFNNVLLNILFIRTYLTHLLQHMQVHVHTVHNTAKMFCANVPGWMIHIVFNRVGFHVFSVLRSRPRFSTAVRIGPCTTAALFVVTQFAPRVRSRCRACVTQRTASRRQGRPWSFTRQSAKSSRTENPATKPGG